MDKISNKEKLEFVSLVVKDKKLPEHAYSLLIEKLNEQFSEEERNWYLNNLEMYLTYHPTNDFPVSLDDLWKLLGYANKGNAKLFLENNFEKDTDYKIERVTNLERKHGGHNAEKITLNIKTFKMFCLMAKTEKGKKIRKYHIKLEDIYNDILRNQLTIFENKPETVGFSRQGGFVYLIEDTVQPGRYKIGCTNDAERRSRDLNCASSTKSLKLLVAFRTFDKYFAEKLIHQALQPYRIVNNKKTSEWFFFKNSVELEHAIKEMKTCVDFIEKFNVNCYVSESQ